MRDIESLTDIGIRLKEERKKRREFSNENRSEKDFVCKRGHDIVSFDLRRLKKNEPTSETFRRKTKRLPKRWMVGGE